MTSTAEIIAIGDELLRGIVQESNAHWLAKRLVARGAALTRVTTLPDDPAVVAGEINAAIGRDPTIVITHGGLGPTEDDRTRAIIARALGRRQRRDAGAERIVRVRYDELAAEGRVADGAASAARLRMADLPEGARALDNQIGAAPAFTIALERTTIIALPGVPPELEWIWENPLAPVLDELLGPGGFGEDTITLDWLDESFLAGELETIARTHPGVYVKSRARGFGDDDQVRITVHAVAGSDAQARALVEAAMDDVRAALGRLGIRPAQ